jgi:ketosteroid isomerase-like protein
MSTNRTAVLQRLLQNTTNLAVLNQLMTPDAAYVSLNFDNPELKKIMPWAGTHKGPQALPEVFAAMQRFWKTLDFKVSDTIEQGDRVAFFGSFTYKSNTTGKEITSPFGLLARFEGGKVAYVQFLEDSYAP